MKMHKGLSLRILLILLWENKKQFSLSPDKGSFQKVLGGTL
ncbi:hypothetical protein CLOSTMETH_02708 [[Clostridium] methylpentosum DSM 5476]|uniref:Uncharacterized protein n=1 Tax=[Clostridium] methylpentosum DSM 5476 TaxID=537013 RepID=C0EFR6_9FIRM|nr:hypothetical protein CLOSTMETH_02708 [[Clostridium] methylpentosum DSM 5476]